MSNKPISGRYEGGGPESEFQPGSRDRVLRNLLGITRVRDMHEAESQALVLAQEQALDIYGSSHRFTAEDVCNLHRLWLGAIYPWAGQYRQLNIGKAGFQFAHAPLIPGLMSALERGALRKHTPCCPAGPVDLTRALAEVHAELVLIHPFRDGNGRVARLLALLMGLQAGLPPLDFSPLGGRGRQRYIASIHAALGRDYEPMVALLMRVIARS